jgi:hypothetical protein
MQTEHGRVFEEMALTGAHVLEFHGPSSRIDIPRGLRWASGVARRIIPKAFGM